MLIKNAVKKLFLLLLLLALFSGVRAQSRYQYHINLKANGYKAVIRSIEIQYDSLLLRVDTNGNIRILNAAQGNYDHYTGFDDKFKQGKLKTIGNIQLDYYDSFADKDVAGKLKSIGDINITYYDQFNGSARGKVKAIGDITFTYINKYNGFDNIGKLSSIGDTKITYYDRFDGGDNMGKLKTIGNTKIEWFNRFDARENFGKLKSIKGDEPNLNVVNEEKLD